MSFRNAAATLPAALASLLAQTFQNWELIAVDDHSSDHSAEIVEAVADPRVRLTRFPEVGLVPALRHGSGLVAGEWLARMDADDICDPRRLEKQLAFADTHPELDVIACQVSVLDPIGEGLVRYVDWVNGLADHEAMAKSRFIESPVVNPSAMIRRIAFDRIGGYHDPLWAEDHDFWLRLLEDGARFGRVPEVLLQWRDSETRLTRTHPRYGDEARSRMRAHYLARLPGAKERGIVIAGAGPIGKLLARHLEDEGVVVRGFFDVHPRRVGECIRGVEVADSAGLGIRWRESTLVSAVGVPGGRQVVRELALERGYREGVDFWCVC
ncbi:glycosyltransferase [Luteolibacter ambystomatis]|uniref:Glycosyltransferase n=1 Tax=Luteolibacter ambystomatis TaxID=2824561 RepID=A0A975G915_9BACT|nr:glycosyltransferase [Luteolibacter ambystomatis]QUE51006.1 glycosyltransferase [Luteolibacter ambystomatis]